MHNVRSINYSGMLCQSIYVPDLNYNYSRKRLPSYKWHACMSTIKHFCSYINHHNHIIIPTMHLNSVSMETILGIQVYSFIHTCNGISKIFLEMFPSQAIIIFTLILCTNTSNFNLRFFYSLYRLHASTL